MPFTSVTAPAPIEELTKSWVERPPPVALSSAARTLLSIGMKPEPIRPPSEWPM